THALLSDLVAQEGIGFERSHVQAQLRKRHGELTAPRSEIEDAPVRRRVAADRLEQEAIVILRLAHHFEVFNAAVRFLLLHLEPHSRCGARLRAYKKVFAAMKLKAKPPAAPTARGTIGSDLS